MYKKKILITGVAGFIGYHCAKCLLNENYEVYGIDNLNDYYDIQLKEDRLQILNRFTNFKFEKVNIEIKDNLERHFEKIKPDYVLHLAAQAGVRYSLENPDIYISTNIVGFYNVIECCKQTRPEHIIFASSSSVYGNIDKDIFTTNDRADEPVSLYAATKKANEEIAYAYAKTFDLKITGLRFFTVYGPYGRPDMAYYSFANAIRKNDAIKMYNYGNVFRDYTYIEDVIETIKRLICITPEPNHDGVNYITYNVANGKSHSVTELVELIEKCIGKKAHKEFVEMQTGDVKKTKAEITSLSNKIEYKPRYDLKEGIEKFIDWYKEYYGED